MYSGSSRFRIGYYRELVGFSIREEKDVPVKTILIAWMRDFFKTEKAHHDYGSHIHT